MKKRIYKACKVISMITICIFMTFFMMASVYAEDEKIVGSVFSGGVERDIVLVLDRSGSMEGEPLTQTKQAAMKFFDTIFEQNSRVGIVSYSSYADIDSEFINDKTMLNNIVTEMEAYGSTNMYDGLQRADEMFLNSNADKKIVVLMSDGLPNEGITDANGAYDTALIDYAETMKNKGYYIYTLGFFNQLMGADKVFAQNLLEGIASPGLHYEVDSADNLVYFFDDIANQISGKEYVYVRIACPVDVTVSSDNEILTSKADSENTRTSFGTLTYEEVQGEEGTTESESETDKVKVLRLDMSKDYDIEIDGYASGTMDYTIIYPDKNGEYTDVRKFPNITVTATTNALASTALSDASYLQVDNDGDGKYETKYKTESNGTMEEVKNTNYLIIIICLLIAVIVVIIIVTIITTSNFRRKEAEGMIVGLFGGLQGQEFPIYVGHQYMIGRSTDCEICIMHRNSKISRRHCCIQLMSNGQYRVTDYSSNGTYSGSDNQRLPRNMQCSLPKGTLLVLGTPDNVIELR